MEQYDILRQALKDKSALSMEMGKDYDELKNMINDYNKKEPVSKTTIERLFKKRGYDGNFSDSTLSILSRYIGFKDWNDFCNNYGKKESEFISEKIILSKDLSKGDLILFEWNPDRKYVAEYLGENRFVIKEKQNGDNLKVGDEFITTEFRLNDRLEIDVLQYIDNKTCKKKYFAGNKSGLTKIEKYTSIDANTD